MLKAQGQIFKDVPRHRRLLTRGYTLGLPKNDQGPADFSLGALLHHLQADVLALPSGIHHRCLIGYQEDIRSCSAVRDRTARKGSSRTRDTYLLASQSVRTPRKRMGVSPYYLKNCIMISFPIPDIYADRYVCLNPDLDAVHWKPGWEFSPVEPCLRYPYEKRSGVREGGRYLR